MGKDQHLKGVWSACVKRGKNSSKKRSLWGFTLVLKVKKKKTKKRTYKTYILVPRRVFFCRNWKTHILFLNLKEGVYSFSNIEYSLKNKLQERVLNFSLASPVNFFFQMNFNSNMQYLKTAKQWRIAGNVKNTGAVLDTNSNLCSASTLPFWISESQDHVNAIPIRG